MIKQLILLIQVLGLFFYQLIFIGDLTVTQKVPDSITKGQEAVIEITINKGDLLGFAKVQQVFPAGFTAEAIETKGATFSFKDDKVKFIWMALPLEKEFTISYKIVPSESVVGKFSLGGKFSFILESERKNIEIPIANFNVVTEGLVAEVIPEEEAEEVIIEEDILKIVAVNCNRTIENVEGRKYKVTIEVDKNGIEGFAKITEEIPTGFIVTEVDSKGGVFSFKENTVKILWMAIPKEEKYTVVYNLEANSTTINGTYNIKGNYAYLENDKTSKYTIDSSSFDLNSAEVFAEEPLVEEVIEKVIPVEELIVTKAPAEKTVAELVLKEEVVDEKVATVIPNPEHGVTYKVQVGAGHKKVSETYFKTRFNLKDNVLTMNHEGWIKYLVGSYNGYKSARDKRNKVRDNVKSAFVTAYNSGTRITVQEALMISNQKWYK